MLETACSSLVLFLEHCKHKRLLPMTSSTLHTVHTARFGTVEVPQDRLYHFISPILGFEEHTCFALLDHSEESPFKWMQSTHDPELAFVVTSPSLFELEFEFVLPDASVEALGLKSAEEVLVLTLVTIPDENPALMTTNLLGPLVINLTSNKAMQLILQDNDRFSTRVRLLADDAFVGETPEATTLTPVEG
jgi:flagellar assembly factor FliW